VPALAGWVVARMTILSGWFLADARVDGAGVPQGRLHLDQALMTWDGTYYRVIAEGWYRGPATPDDAVRFFPGYPSLGRALSVLTFGNVDAALLVISNAAALASAVVLWMLATEVLGEEAAGRRAAWMVAVLPPAIVLAFAYSEALTLLCTSLALLMLHRRRLLWVAALGLACGLLRPAGVLLVAPVLVEAWRRWREEGAPRPDPREAAAWFTGIAAPVAGLGTALVVAAGPGGDLAEVFRLHRTLRQGFRDPATRLVEAVLDVVSGDFADLYNVAFALGFLALVVVAVRMRQPPSWIVFMLVTWVVAVGGNNMDSGGRYALVAAPFTLALAQWAQRRWQQVVVGVAGVLGCTWFAAEVFLGRVIP